MFNVARLFTALVMVISLAGVDAQNRRITQSKSRFLERQAVGSGGPFTGPTTVESVETTTTPQGTRVETCTITLTPIVEDGVDLVREDRTCTIQFIPVEATSSITGTPEATQSEAIPSLTTSTSFSTATEFVTVFPSLTTTETSVSTTSSETIPVVTDVPSTSSDVTTAVSSTSTLVLTSTSTLSLTSTSSTTSVQSAPTTQLPTSVDRAVEVIGTTTTTPGIITSSSTTSTPTETTPAVVVISTGIVTPSQENTISAPPSPSGSTSNLSSSSSTSTPITASAAQATESAEAIQLPGQKMEVLPIGLGVFAGISAIALIVVAYVTWERRKHRKAFRERQNLAAKAAPMGYGGTTMAKRQV